MSRIIATRLAWLTPRVCLVAFGVLCWAGSIPRVEAAPKRDVPEVGRYPQRILPPAAPPEPAPDFTRGRYLLLKQRVAAVHHSGMLLTVMGGVPLAVGVALVAVGVSYLTSAGSESQFAGLYLGFGSALALPSLIPVITGIVRLVRAGRLRTRLAELERAMGSMRHGTTQDREHGHRHRDRTRWTARSGPSALRVSILSLRF